MMAERERKSDETEGITLVSMLEADLGDVERRIGHKITGQLASPSPQFQY
jgi:hypothetical protein